VQTHRIRLGQLKQGNATRGHAGEVEAAPCRFVEAMPRRFPVPWRADKIPGGCDANGQALAYIYSRESEAEVICRTRDRDAGDRGGRRSVRRKGRTR
jgi:hypothetical protein